MSVKDLAHIESSAAPMSIDAWQACLSRHMLPGLEVATASENRVFADLVSFDFAGARLWSLRSNAQRVIRRQCVPGMRFLPVAIFQLSGTTTLTHGDRQCTLRPETFAFLNAAEPLELDHTSDFEQIYLQFPARTFKPGEFRRVTSITMEAQTPNDRPLFECAKDLWLAAPSLGTFDHWPALNALVSLCSISSAFHQARKDPELSIRVERAMAYIEHHLGDEDLNALTVSAAQGVSRRYLDELFSQCGHRIETWIWERRLLRAADMLAVAEQAEKPLLQIALDVGFKSPSHFSRMFTRRFGMSPKNYRRQQENATRKA